MGGGGKLDADVVLGETDVEAVAETALDEDLGLLALVCLIESDAFALGNLVENGVAMVTLGDGDDGLNGESLGVGAFGIGEDVELRDIDGLDERACLLEKLGRFAIYADNDIDTNESVGDEGLNGLDLLGVEGGIVAAAHELEHGVGARLEGDVKVGHELARRGAMADDVVGEEVWLDGRDAETLYSVDTFELLDEAEERLALVATEIADIYTREDNLACAVGGGLTCHLDRAGY